MRYRPEIDGLRALAVLPVILFHAGFSLFSGGFVGVDVFFVISGYLIGTIVLSEVAERRFSLIHFYERRARRIMPALFTVMFATVPFGWLWMFPDAFREYTHSLISVPLFISNVQFWLETGYFQLAAEEKPLLHTWSLAVEEQYYLLFPLLAMAVYRRGGKVFLSAILSLSVVSLLWAEYASHHYPEANFFLLMGRVWELLAGVLVALWRMRRVYNPSLYGGAAALCGMGMILGAVFLFDASTRFPSLYTLLPVMGAVLVILFANESNKAGKWLSLKPVVGIGLISYSLYLWHQPLFAFARIRSVEPPSQLMFAALIMLSFMLAIFTYRYIETPFRRGKGGGKALLTRRGVFVATAAIGGLLITLGAIGASGVVMARNSAVVNEMQTLFRTNRQGRLNAIRLNECQYNPQSSGDLDTFLALWNCDPYRNPIAGRQPVPVVIAGDSHAADKAAALRLNGFEPLQMGGAGCSIEPATMTPRCRKTFDLLKEKLKGRTEYKELWLAKRHKEQQMQVEHFESVFAYWGETGLRIRLFTPMPRFMDLQKKLMYQKAYGAWQPVQADDAVIKAFGRLPWEEILTPYGGELIDTQRIYCSLTPSCDYKTAEGEMLLTDSEHLSVTGARLFGAALVREGLVPVGKAAISE